MFTDIPIDIKKSECVGCGACYQVCTTNCISMYEDEEGFLYPDIDKENCLLCHKCEAVCPVRNRSDSDGNEKKACFAAYNKDKDIHEKSSSGGVFSQLAEYVLSKGGAVYGVSMTDDFLGAEHCRITDLEEMTRIRGSKYIQSVLGNGYKEVKKDLKQGLMVLFSGTPCQIAGLYAYIGRENSDNLFTVEVICHGVCSTKVWRKYLGWIKNKIGTSIKSVNFRNKKKNTLTGELMMLISSKRKKYMAYSSEDPFYILFLKDLILRPSCYNCYFKNNKSMADITIGDYWNVSEQLPGFGKEGEVSLIFSNTKKGNMLFNIQRNGFECRGINGADAIKWNVAYSTSVKQPHERDLFFSDIDKMIFKKLRRKYARLGKKERLYFFLNKNHLLWIVNSLRRNKHLRISIE